MCLHYIRVHFQLLTIFICSPHKCLDIYKMHRFAVCLLNDKPENYGPFGIADKLFGGHFFAFFYSPFLASALKSRFKRKIVFLIIPAHFIGKPFQSRKQEPPSVFQKWHFSIIWWSLARQECLRFWKPSFRLSVSMVRLNPIALANYKDTPLQAMPSTHIFRPVTPQLHYESWSDFFCSVAHFWPRAILKASRPSEVTNNKASAKIGSRGC